MTDDYREATDRFFAEHLKDFSDHPIKYEWPCPTSGCKGMMVFDLGMEGCYCDKCEHYDGVK